MWADAGAARGIVLAPYDGPPLSSPAYRRILMKSLALKLHRFLASEDGPTAVEYAVMLSLIVVVCLAAINTIGQNANNVFGKAGSSIK
jgi:pilus assembly protein Flp/PilA